MTAPKFYTDIKAGHPYVMMQCNGWRKLLSPQEIVDLLEQRSAWVGATGLTDIQIAAGLKEFETSRGHEYDPSTIVQTRHFDAFRRGAYGDHGGE